MATDSLGGDWRRFAARRDIGGHGSTLVSPKFSAAGVPSCQTRRSLPSCVDPVQSSLSRDLVKGVKKGAGGARSGGHAGHILLCDYDPRASAAAGSVGWMRVLVEPSCRSVGSSTLPGNDHRFGSWEHRQPRTLGRAEHCRDCRYLGARRTVSVPRESVESVATSLLAL